MGQLDDKVAVVTGGSRGVGRGIVDALAGEGAAVWSIGRDAERLEALKREVDGVQTLLGDIADPATATRALAAARPDILILNAGATPHMAPLHEQSWQQFGRVWDTDVQATFHFGKAALALPLAPGSTVIILSSGAAINGSPLSGGYAGAKRMQWLMAGYLQQEADALSLGIRFIALLPKQILGTTELGDTAASAYATRQGITKEKFLERFGVQLTPAAVGQGIVALIADPAYRDGLGYGITGGGLELLD